jgi:hypothetical protein
LKNSAYISTCLMRFFDIFAGICSPAAAMESGAYAERAASICLSAMR